MVVSDADPPAFVRLAGHPLRWRLLTALAASDLRVRELVAAVGQPQNLVSYHLRSLREAGLVAATRSTFDGRDTYYHLDLDRCGDALAAAGAAIHPALAGPRPGNPTGITVLFVCTGNSARSPMAEALLRQRTGGRVRVASAGTRPKPAFHPDAVRVLRETFGIDLAGRPRHLDTVGERFDRVITLCDKAREVVEHPGLVHWSVPDPAVHHRFHDTATDIDARVRQLVPALTTGVSS